MALEVCFFTTLLGLGMHALGGLHALPGDVSAPDMDGPDARGVRDYLLKYMGQIFVGNILGVGRGVAFGIVMAVVFGLLLLSADLGSYSPAAGARKSVRKNPAFVDPKVFLRHSSQVMGFSYLIALLLTFAALTTYLNQRFLKLPTTIALVLFSLGISLVILVAGRVGFAWSQQAQSLVGQIDFGESLMNGMLGYLLFAGSMHVPLDELREHRWPISILATVGVLLTLFFVAAMMSWVFSVLGLNVPWVYCLVFGALISPTDPVAVLDMLRRAGAPRALETGIAGESLFNDGIGVVAFVTCYGLLGQSSEQGPDWPQFWLLVLWQVAGGLGLGLLLGWITYQLLKTVDDYSVEVFLTLAMVSGGYALATALHFSGPLAIVAAGLIIGNLARHQVMSARTRERLDDFWELIDGMLNAVLFVLIGLAVLSLRPTAGTVLAGCLAVPVVLAARWMSVGALLTIIWPEPGRPFPTHSIKLLTWGGLRGGIPVALALSLPAGHERETLLTVTYIIVVFSVVVQGLSFPALLRWALPARGQTALLENEVPNEG